MIRTFDWRDLPLLHRVRNRGLCLDSQLAFTRGPNALQYALLDVLNPGRSACTLVARPSGEPGEQPAVGQFFYRSDAANAHMAFISPEEALEGPWGAVLLEALARSAGEHGAHNLIAEVDEHSPAFESLRRAGFAIYARQHIWQFASPAGDGDPPGEAREIWQTEAASDEPAVHTLYMNLIPALVQQVEEPPRRTGRGLVHWQQGELLGYLSVERGPLGVWVQAYFHPAAEDPQQLLAGLPGRLEPRGERPLYVCVRSYQSWLSGALEALGFSLNAEQAVMVKRLAAAVRQAAPAVLPALEGTIPKPTAPFARSKNIDPGAEVTQPR